jgi:hypothetical protein
MSTHIHHYGGRLLSNMNLYRPKLVKTRVTSSSISQGTCSAGMLMISHVVADCQPTLVSSSSVLSMFVFKPLNVHSQHSLFATSDNLHPFKPHSGTRAGGAISLLLLLLFLLLRHRHRHRHRHRRRCHCHEPHVVLAAVEVAEVVVAA